MLKHCRIEGLRALAELQLHRLSAAALLNHRMASRNEIGHLAILPDKDSGRRLGAYLRILLDAQLDDQIELRLHVLGRYATTKENHNGRSARQKSLVHGAYFFPRIPIFSKIPRSSPARAGIAPYMRIELSMWSKAEGIREARSAGPAPARICRTDPCTVS